MAPNLNTAYAHHQAGNLPQAETLYRQILESDPRNADALHLLGLVHIQTGRPDPAVEYIRQAVALNDKVGAYHNHLGVALGKREQFEEAVDCFRRAASQDSRLKDVHFNLGNALRALGRMEAAVKAYETALAIDSHSAETYFNLANTFRDLGRLKEATASYRHALQVKPGYLKAQANLGGVLRKQRRFEEAEECYRATLRIKPDYAPAYHNLGSLASERRRFAAAESHFREALRINPDLLAARNGLGKALMEQGKLDEAIALLESTSGHSNDLIETQLNLGEKLRAQGRSDDAIACARKVTELHGDMALAHNNLGLALAARGDLNAAIDCYRRALQIKRDLVEVHNNLAVALQLAEQVSEAAEHIEAALRIQPQFPVAHLNRAAAWLRDGDFPNGWLEFEWRFQCENHRIRRFHKPRWTGEPLPEGAVLLHSEQGFGDTIQFIRYAALVKQRVGRVIVLCQKQLVPLLSRCRDIDQLVPRGEQLPDHDVQLPLASLPGILGTTLGTIPADVPYVLAEEQLVETWRQRLAAYDGFKIGVAWQGNRQYATDAYRSLPLRHFAPLARVEGVRLLSLQKGHGSEQLGDLPEEIRPVDFGSQLDEDCGTFMDTAAIMQNLDLMITSDTAIAHLAGAMGVPIWVALSGCSDWRWLADREDSPWYPTMRLFRQTRLGDWDGLFARIAAELEAVVAGDTSRLRPPSSGVTAPIRVPISPGELLDKLTILQIKSERITDAAKLANVRSELTELSAVWQREVPLSTGLTALAEQLRDINRRLWEVEDEIRRCESQQDFGPRFVELARAVYVTNDRRAAVKQEINLLLKSTILEAKEYLGAGSLAEG